MCLLPEIEKRKKSQRWGGLKLAGDNDLNTYQLIHQLTNAERLSVGGWQSR